MGLSVSTLFRRAPKNETRILMLGIDAAGKTTILYKLQIGEVVTTIPTIGFNVETLKYQRASVVELVAFDVGGRDPLRSLWRHYYKMTNCLMFVVDSNDRDRMEQVKDELHRLLAEDDLRECPLLVFANKQDLPNAMRGQEVTEKLGLRQLHEFGLADRCWFVQESTALDGSGLCEGMEWLSQALRGELAPPQVLPKPGKVSNKDREFADDGISLADTDSTADTEAPVTHA